MVLQADSDAEILTQTWHPLFPTKKTPKWLVGWSVRSLGREGGGEGRAGGEGGRERSQ